MRCHPERGRKRVAGPLLFLLADYLTATERQTRPPERLPLSLLGFMLEAFSEAPP